MGSINPNYNDRVRYTLYQEGYGSMVITEPIGWETDEKELARNENYHGIFTKFSNSLTFIGDAIYFIENVREIYDVNANIRLTREEKHPRKDEWYKSYDGFLDMSTFEKENNQISIKFNAGGIEEMLKARENEKIEIEKEQTFEGSSLDELQTANVFLEGRRIFLRTFLEQDNNNDSLNNLTVFSDIGAVRSKIAGYPLKMVTNSHQNIAKGVTPEIYTEIHQQGDLDQMILFDVDRMRDFKLMFNNLSFRPLITEYDVQWAYFTVQLTVFENGLDFDRKESIQLYRADNFTESSGVMIPPPPIFDNDRDDYLDEISNQNINIQNQELEITLLAGESLALEVMIESNLRSEAFGRARFYVNVKDITGELTIEENSFFRPTTTKAIMAYELGERLSEIITNRKNVFKSKALGRTDLGYTQNGFASMTALAHGFWIRQFDKEPDTEKNKYKSLTTSWRDYVESLQVVWNLGLGIERDGFRETVRIENQKYFYNNNVTIRLPNQVSNVKRSIADKKYFSGLDIGYQKGGEYEEAMGLDEYNASTNFVSPIVRIQNKIDIKSKYRADSYGREFARRQPEELDPSKDTSYDKDIHILDVKQSLENNYLMRKWQDDFEEEPEGVFSPETATNLRLSPMQLLKRHAWEICSGLTKFPEKHIRYSSSSANSKLKTKIANEIPFAENDDVLINDLETARFVPEWIEFDHIVDFDIAQKLEGYTTILGEKIPNMYGLVEFINENNEKERGYIFSVKPNGEGKWKLLKANR